MFLDIVEWCETKCKVNSGEIKYTRKKGTPKWLVTPPQCRECTKSFCGLVKDKENLLDQSLVHFAHEKFEPNVTQNIDEIGNTLTENVNISTKVVPKNNKQLSLSTDVVQTEPRSTSTNNSDDTCDVKKQIMSKPISKSADVGRIQKIGCRINTRQNVENKKYLEQRKKKEWSANVEQELLKLYRNCPPNMEPEWEWAVFRSQSAQNNSHSSKRLALEANNLEQTPSYILAMSNLFRKRRQVAL